VPGLVEVVVADPHRLSRASFVELLHSMGNARVVGQASRGAELLDLLSTTHPEIVFLDAELPGPGLARLIGRIRAEARETNVIVLASNEDPDLAIEAIEAGALGFLLKSTDKGAVSAAIALGGRLAEGDCEDEVLVHLSRHAFLYLAGRGDAMSLSPREREVLAELLHAHSNRVIAAHLHVSDATVKRHLTSIYAKLGVQSRLEAIVAAKRLGLGGVGPARLLSEPSRHRRGA